MILKGNGKGKEEKESEKWDKTHHVARYLMLFKLDNNWENEIIEE